MLSPINIVSKDGSQQNNFNKIPLFDSSVSAGGGTWLDEHIDSNLIYSHDMPHGTDFALRIYGDSMEPMYSNGEIVFVRRNVIIESGQVGVFCLNDESYLKMLQGNKLVSLNSKYKPIIIDEEDRFYCIGRVIGKTTSDNIV
jgi:phage repressor protein C with HTH and peptisase S24 domain